MVLRFCPWGTGCFNSFFFFGIPVIEVRMFYSQLMEELLSLGYVLICCPYRLASTTYFARSMVKSRVVLGSGGVLFMALLVSRCL